MEYLDIDDYDNWVNIKEIKAGWSLDRKYYIETKDNKRLLLRIADIDFYKRKKLEFNFIKKINNLNFSMSKAISFGLCNNQECVYMILSWIDGTPLCEILNQLPETKQYLLGIDAGKILKSIHSIPIETCDISTKSKIAHKLKQLKNYETSQFRVENDENIISYIKNNINKIDSLPPVYQHGDFHAGNLILNPNKSLGVIDFNRYDCGDKYEEFLKVQSFDVEISIPFSIGQINGYFDNNPPRDFWEILSVYVAHTSLFSINWAEKFGTEAINDMKRRCEEAISDYNNFQEIIPRWYKTNNLQFTK